MKSTAPNMIAIMAYVRESRPDCVDTMETIIDADDMGNGGMNAARFHIFLLAIAFSAGRAYQRKHPHLDELVFHTDPGVQPPPTTEPPPPRQSGRVKKGG